MAQLGMLALGAFIGGILCLGLPVTQSVGTDEFIKLAGFVITSALTGPVFTWVGKLGGIQQLGDALFVYPIGLFLAMLWFYVRLSISNLAAPETDIKVVVVSMLHIAAITAVTLVAAYLFAGPVLFPKCFRKEP
jgi:hypothetical protein